VREARDEGRAEGRAEAEAAAEQRLAALDQARREEREAAVREALALGVRQVSARLHACSPLAYAACAPSHHTARHAAKLLRMPAGGPGAGSNAAVRAIGC